jgi:hypothetical protein
MMFRRITLALRLDQRAATAVEFALVAPLFLMTLFGIMDYGMQFYGQHVLQGVVSQSARNSALEQNISEVGRDTLNGVVTSAVKKIFPGAELEFKRSAYLSYEEIGKSERIVDKDGNDALSSGECFIDTNGSGTWDSVSGRVDKDGGIQGSGGPDDIILYEVTMTFDRMFPFWALVNQPQQSEMKASTTLRNQPFGKAMYEARKICRT